MINCFAKNSPKTSTKLAIILDWEGKGAVAARQTALGHRFIGNSGKRPTAIELLLTLELLLTFSTNLLRWGSTVLVLALMFVSRSAWSTERNQVSGSSADEIQHGVVVEGLVHGEGEKAGLRERDILLTWSRGNERGDIQSPFDLRTIEIEQGPQGIVTLQGLRNAEAQSWALGQDGWGFQVRPMLSEANLAVYSEGREFANAGKPAQAEERWHALADRDQSRASPWLRSWLLLHIAELQAEARQWKEADRAYQESLQSVATASAEIQRQVLRAWARTFEQRSLWSQAELYYEQAATKDGSSPDNLSRALDLDNIGKVAERRGDFSRAEDCFLRSLKIRQRRFPDSIVVASSFNNLGNLQIDRGEIDKAQDYFRQALAILQKVVPVTLPITTTLMGLGNVAFDRGDLAKASLYYSQALEIRERIAPGSLDVAKTLNALGNVAYRRGDLSPAAEYYRRALVIKQTLSPGSLSVASTLANLGNVAHDRGDLARAEEYYRQDLEITEKLAPGSLDFAGSLMDLGIICQRRGDLVHAEEYYRRALEIKRKLAPDSLDLAYTLNNLGSVAQDRGDLVRAEEYYRQALEIRNRLAPGSLDVAGALNNLGEIALESDDLVRAEEYDRQSLEIKERIAPASLDVAIGLENLGAVVQRRGDLPRAEEYEQRALSLLDSIAPISVATASCLDRLGALAKDRGDLDSAEQYHRRALDIWEKLAPASANQAESLADLALIMRQRGHLNEAAQLYERALSAIEGQTARLGGADEVRAGFRARHESLYRGYADLLVVQGKANTAFRVLELSRARTLLETLGSAHIDIRKGADSDLVKRERTLQQSLSAKSNRRIQLLASTHSDEQIAAVDKELEALLAEYKDVEGQIRISSPAYAALTQPHMLSAQEVQEQLLDPDSLLLEYSLGNERSLVFAISAHSVQAFALPRRQEVEQLAKRVYGLLAARNQFLKDENERRRQLRVAQADSEYFKAASALSHLLLGPVESQLGHKRLLIVADGSLLHIPFAALPEPGTSDAEARAPLMVKHEIVNLPSASVPAILRRQRSTGTQPAKEAVILADPVFTREDERVTGKPLDKPLSQVEKNDPVLLPWSSDTLTRSAKEADLLREGQIHLARLPFSRREADLISAVIPAGKIRMALDFQASRKLAVSGELAQYRVVHFATHALVNDKHPDLSGLVLSLVDEHGQPQQGFLDLQDIYNLDLAADLVVLSACETALGKEIDGEGMIGLTRGFMYAGARSIIGTLWKVEDFATAKFMMAFYKAMEQNRMSTAQAVRHAQLALWKEKHWSAPYYWAAFTVQGDWE